MSPTSNPWTITVGDDAGGGNGSAPAPVRAPLVGTEQQEEFWLELLTGSNHVLLEARAGTGKSSSCREGMWRLLESNRSLSLRYCCFNKKIADEFREKCPPGVEVNTMHSFGLKALQKAFGNPLIEKNKSYVMVDSLPGGSALPKWMRRTITNVVSIAKNHCLRPGSKGLATVLDELVLHYDIETWKRSDEVVDWACEVLKKSLESTSLLDFDDMLWLPVMLGIRFPEVDFLFIDEAQDLNTTQHELMLLMNSAGRTIITGDPYQAIYMWRGADADSIAVMRHRLGAETMPLTITWRCPTSHVELARQYVADFYAGPGAAEGRIERAGIEAVETARPGSLVLCRANAPNISACLKMLTQRKRATVRGRALGDQLNAVVRRIDADTITDLMRGIASWKSGQIGRLERRDGTEDLIEAVTDKALALTAICDTCGSPAEVPGVIDMLFSDDDATNRVTFSSVHRAKGSEAREVYYIQIPYSVERDKKRPPHPWELQQRRNIEYVALTRSLDSLTLLDPKSERKPSDVVPLGS